ncbi:Novel helicase-like [Nesidiocoris tenuis]|uniref:Novel helicase-like n=1 Tax=Nesidiocoris tenuis TaxID=355587 RepID=A0ABN7B9I6_9HEMI|nr:Novel helicase-like [Nesidiocoris tenuis]
MDDIIDLTDSQMAQAAETPQPPTHVNIEGVDVAFPFKPYDVQEVYMSKVIKTLNQRSVAALESPTGTGKTLSLLCSTLAWLEKEKQANMRGYKKGGPEDDYSNDWGGAGKYFRKVVYYASRTHSQLSKAMAELRRTPYRHVRATIIASRDQLCIHPDLPVEENLHTKNAFCQTHVSAKTCRFYTRVESVKSDPSFFQVKDIEDLVARSKKTGCCPFYLTRHLQEEAEVVFLPYDYIFDRSIRRRLNLNFNGAIVILDEGHNIEGKCEEAASVELSSTDIAVGIRDITEEMKKIHEELNSLDEEMIERSYTTEDLIFMKEKLIALEEAFDEFMKNLKESSREYRPDTLKSLLGQATIDEESHSRLESGLGAVYDVVVAQNSVNSRTRHQACTLRKVADFISAPFQLDVFSPKNLNSFVVHAELVFEATKRNNFGTPISANDRSKAKGIKFDLWCLNPSVGMHPLGNVHSLILTSGTLSPLKNAILELGLKNFEAVRNGAELQTAELGHVVSQDQFMIFALGKGPNNVQLSSGYANKDNLSYWEELGFVLQNFIRLIPDGVLMFFPSYGALNKAINTWKFKGLWDRLNAIKPLFSEETDKRRFNMAVEGYRTSVDAKKGGVLMGVCRGKMSEGIDFSDQYGRAVVVCGLPYASFVNPRIKCKMRYIDSLGIRELRGDDWYRNDATKAVNQATGRVIRHAKDVGVILLCDAKFEQPGIQAAMSSWLKPVRTMRSFGEAVSALRCFFRKHPVLFKKEAPVATSACVPAPAVDLTSAPSSSSSAGPTSCKLPTRPLEKPSKSSCLEILAEDDNENDVAPKKLPPNSPIKSWRQVVRQATNVEITGPATKRSSRPTPFIPNKMRVEPDTPENRQKTRLMNEYKFLLHEIKRTLDDKSYQIFFNVLKMYQKDKDLTIYMDKLSIFFPKDDPLLSDYFRDCHKFLTSEHKKRFIEYCAVNGYGVVVSSSRILEEPPEP